MPLKMLMSEVAETRFMLNTVVRYTCRFDSVPIAPNFSKVSFPAGVVCYVNQEILYVHFWLGDLPMTKGMTLRPL